MVKFEKNQNRTALLIRIFIVVAALVLWELAARFSWYNPFFTSYPSEIALDLVLFAESGDLFYHTSITLSEAFSGLLYGTLAGIILAVIFGQFSLFGKVLTPIVSAINCIPQLALAPVYILWFGVGMTSKIFLSGLMVFFCVFFSTYNAIRGTDQELIDSAHLLGAQKIQTLRHVILPYCMPWIFSGIRAGVGACMVGAIIGEYMGAAGGFGWMVTYATNFFMIRRVMSCILILLVVGLLLNWILDRIEARILRWRPQINLSMEQGTQQTSGAAASPASNPSFT